ncbi:MAG: hypothetical protein DRP86_08480, partial [Candidatus Neomarinimicrobiota bacterium]
MLMKTEMQIRMRIFIPAIILLIATALPATAQDSGNPSVPYFTDSMRAEKVHASHSVMDRMFRQFARTEHLPGLVYG